MIHNHNYFHFVFPFQLNFFSFHLPSQIGAAAERYEHALLAQKNKQPEEAKEKFLRILHDKDILALAVCLALTYTPPSSLFPKCGELGN